ncbi:MAG TPA: hypothetical protein VFR68_09810 [Candidatus Dormibacteraeota bacterium]|nr:hypothetical protein [Candidatus Dormibacteraeota bacterium]
MPGWLTLVIHLEPSADERHRLLAPLMTGESFVNQTTLRDVDNEVGSLVALSKDALRAAKEVTEQLEGRARAVRIDAEMIARDPASAAPAYVFLAANLQRLSIDHDDVTVVGAIRAYLGQYLPYLGHHFVAVSTLLDKIRYAGGLTAIDADSIAEAQVLTTDDPWGRIFPGHLYQTTSPFFQCRLPPPGPGSQRSGGGSPWPFHWEVAS